MLVRLATELCCFFFSSRRRHTRLQGDWSSDVCSSDLDAKRPNARRALDDFGHLGAIKQHADVVLGLYREEMYNPGHGVDGATELIVLKNRNGPTGFVDLYFYRRWMRFEDMLDPDR